MRSLAGQGGGTLQISYWSGVRMCELVLVLKMDTLGEFFTSEYNL